MTKNYLIYSVLFVLLFDRSESTKSNIVLDLNDGGYSNIVVALSNDIADADVDGVVQNIKDAFNAMNKMLSTAYNAGTNAYYIRNVSIIVPGIYSKTTDPPTFEWRDSADFVAMTDGLFAGVRTQHTRDCGDPGDVVNINLKSLTDLFATGKPLLREFVKYRYGVFDEGDEHATLSYTGFTGTASDDKQFQPNACLNKLVIGNLTSSKHVDANCNVSGKDQIWMPRECYLEPDPDPTVNSGLTSSLLYTDGVGLHSMVQFCNNQTHDGSAPTEQNRKCSGNSIIEVMLEHPDDFPGGAGRQGQPTAHDNITFNVVRRTQKLIVLIDNQLEVGPLKNTVLRTLHKYAKNGYFQQDTQIGIYVTAANAKVYEYKGIKDFPISSTDFFNSFDAAVKDKTLDFKAAMDQAISDLQGTGSILVIAGDKLQVNENVTGLSSNIRISSVSLNSDLLKTTLYQLANLTGGKLYDAGPDISVDSLYASWHLEEALQDIVNSISRDIVQVNRAIMDPKKGWSVPFATGTLDGTLYLNLDCESSCNGMTSGSLINVGYIFDDSSISKQTVTFTDVDTSIALPPPAPPKAGVQLIQATLEFYNASQSANDRIYVSVVGKSADKQTATNLFLRTWIHAIENVTTSDDRKVMNYNTPLPRVFAQLTYENFPIDEAKVTVTVTGEDGSSSSADLRSSGYPNWIYSAYLVNITKVQKYRVDVTATGNSQTVKVTGIIDSGSEATVMNKTIQYLDKEVTYSVEPTGYFKRTDESNQLFIWDEMQLRSRNLAEKIVDFVVSDIKKNDTGVNVTFTWTAPGRILDWGTADGYNLKFSYDLGVIKTPGGGTNAQNLVVAGSLNPLPAGSRQTVTIWFKAGEQRSIYVKIETYNKNDRSTSDRSFILTLQLAPKPPSTSNSGGLSAGAIIGIIILVLVALAGAIWVTCRVMKNRRRGILEDNTFH